MNILQEKEKTAVETLKFLTLRSDRLSLFDGYEPEEILKFVHKHRIGGRILKRISETRAGPRKTIIDTIESYQRRVLRDFERKQVILNEFISNFCFDMDVLLYKYNTSFFFLGDERLLRPFGDFDLAVTKPMVLKSRLQERDLQVKRNRYPPHEFLNAHYKEEAFDLHRYIPLWERVDDFVPPASFCPGVLNLGARVIERGVPPVQCFTTGHKLTLSNCSFSIPSATFCVLFIIATSYKDFVTHNVSHLYNQPELRMSDICECLDLITHEGFDTNHFMWLVSKFRLQEAVTWFSEVIFELAQIDVLQDMGFTPERIFQVSSRPVSFQRLVAGGFWLPFDGNPALDISSRRGTHEVTAAVGAKEISIRDGECLELNIGDNKTRETVGVAVVGATVLDQHVIHIARSGDCLTIDIPGGAEIQEHFRVYLECNGEMFEWENQDELATVQYLWGTQKATSSLKAFSMIAETVLRCEIDFNTLLEKRVAHIVVSAAAPLLPWEAERGWLACITLRFC